jgi:zinc protease
MRNPAPTLLTLLLAAILAFFFFRQPDEKPADTGESAATAPGEILWPHQESDIPPDPGAVFGSLENGMSYIILPNDEPPGRVSVRLHIAAGSLMEDDNQRGLAHFLEHMVFNGTEHFDPDELIPRMQRLGIAFGAHVNAYTSFDETVYMLDLPETGDDMLDLGFTVMRDFADGALLEAEEIDKERGVILAEKNSRDSVDYRMMKTQFSTLLPDSLVSRRFPIGTEDVIENAPREAFVDFYESYYTPERMTFVVVGDIDPETAEARVRATFGDMTNPDSPGADPDLGSVARDEGFEAEVFADPEVSGTDLELLAIEDFAPEPDTRERRAERLPLALAHSILDRRFDRLADEDGSPIRGGSASRSELFNHFTLGSLGVQVADDRWGDAVPVLEQTHRRALDHGFTAAELAEARANLINALEQQVKAAETRRSDGLATAIVRSINDRRVLTAPETDLEIAVEALDGIEPADCHRAFRDFWSGKSLRLILTTEEAGEDTRAELRRLFEMSRETVVEAPEEAEAVPFAYTDFGAAGGVAERTEIDGLGITRLRLDNGVTVNFKPTDFENNRIRLTARIGHGQLVQPADSPGLAEFATALVNGSGIGEHSRNELRRIFAGRNVSVGFSVEEDHFQIAGSTTPGDLDLQLQAMAAKILHPGYRDEALRRFRKGVPAIYQQLRHTLAGPMSDMSAWLRGGDPRFAFPDDPEVLLGYTIDDARSWLESDFTPAPIELNVVGDFDPDELIPGILRTFGALDDREPGDGPGPAARRVDFPEAPATRSFRYRSQVEKGRAVILWRIPGPRENEKRFRRYQVLADILGDRLRETVREKLGASYSPQAGASGSTALEDFGFLISLSEGGPEDVGVLTETTLDLAHRLAVDGATADELERTLNPLLADLEKSLRDNGYWLEAVLSGSTAAPRKFDLARDRLDDVESITLAEINELAAGHLSRAQALVARMTPEPEAPVPDAVVPEPETALPEIPNPGGAE